MRIKKIITVVLFVLSVFALQAQAGTATENAQSNVQPDSVLGVPWGASQEQARQIMEKNGFSVHPIMKEPNFRELSFGYGDAWLVYISGRYAGYKASPMISFMNDQMFSMSIRISGEESSSNKVYDDLKKLLTEKYGASSGDQLVPAPNHYYADSTECRWELSGKSITLSKAPPHETKERGKTLILGNTVDVTYRNNELYEKLKNKARSNI